MNNTITVSQLNRYVKAVLEENSKLKELYVKGEISNFTHHHASGHLYFTLQEGGCSIRCVMFASAAKGLIFRPEDGMKVLARCGVSLYERDGTYQLYVYDMQPDGLGALYVAFLQLQQKLQQEGLFEQIHKKSLPLYPSKIAVITSATGAALQDILSILGQRYPVVQVTVYPVLVQGLGAAPSMIAALEQVQTRNDADVVIIGRGGGSMEDLWAFNQEKLVRKIFEMSIPVISAVGHETDFTLCDYVADARAETPSAAAQMATPDMRDVLYHLSVLQSTVNGAISAQIQQQARRLEEISFSVQEPSKRLEQLHTCLSGVQEEISRAMLRLLRDKEGLLAGKAELIASTNPLHLLRRGYAFTTDVHNKVMTSVQSLCVGQELMTQLMDGTVQSVITHLTPSIEIKKEKAIL